MHAAVLLAFLLASCSLGPEARLTVLLPDLPAHWRVAFPGLQCLLVFVDGTGTVMSTVIADWSSGAQIYCGKRGNSPILAYPLLAAEAEIAGPGLLRPAGGIYPDSLLELSDDPGIRLSWEDGAVAAVLWRLLCAGRDTSLFNAGRLGDRFREVNDPWNLDLGAIAEAIALGGFTVYDIDSLPSRDITVPAGQGEWFLESPFSPVSRAGGDGNLALTGITRGLHALFSLDGRAVRIDVRAHETATVALE